jgi:4-amino-4-deoxy-L-arabinose transferase-like glycosyltransferase
MTMSDNSETESTATPPEDNDDLKRKLVEIEAKVSTLENEISSLRPVETKPSRETWIFRFILVIVSILAVIPPALVVTDMWFRKLPNDLDGGAWCMVPFLCSSMLPSYFAIILRCFFILAVILFYLRNKTVVVQEHPLRLFENHVVSPGQMRIGFGLLVLSGLGMVGVIILSLISQHWPGWDLVIVWLLYMSGWALRTISPSKLVELWNKDGDFWISMLLMHIAIVAVLVGYYDVTQVFYAALILLVVAFANLWHFRQRVPIIFWVISVTLVFYTININGWWTAIIGDDQGFHELAWAFAEKMNFAQVGNFLFQANGVSDSHPYFSSFVQAISMKLFGHGSFGWRFSNLYLCAMGVGLFYFFCKSFLSQRAALVAACLLAFSHYVMSFGKIGYNNLQALFAFSLVLAVAAWALRWKQPFVFALLGSAMALCFYLYPASLYVVPLPILLLLMYYPPTSRQAIGRWLVMVAIWVAMIYPLLMQPIYWESKQAGTLFHRPELVQSVDMVVQHFAYNIFYSILSFLYITEGHYVVASFIDPITAIFIMLGYFILLYQIRRQHFAIFVALGFVFFLFSVGASHDREVPSTTRMFLMLPWFALFGMWGMIWLEENIKKVGLFRPNSKMVLVPILLVAIAGANLYQAYKLSPMRYAATQSTATLYLAVTENIYKAQPGKQKNIAFVAQDGWGYETLQYFQDVYPYLDWFHLYPIMITEPVLPQDKMALFSDPETIIIVAPYLEPEWQNALDAPLTALGKTRCDIWIPDMRKLLVVYYTPDLPPQICLFDTGLALDEKTATQNP